ASRSSAQKLMVANPRNIVVESADVTKLGTGQVSKVLRNGPIRPESASKTWRAWTVSAEVQRSVGAEPWRRRRDGDVPRAGTARGWSRLSQGLLRGFLHVVAAREDARARG